MLATSVIADVIGVVREFYSRENLKRRSVKDLCSAVTTTGYEETIGGDVVEHSLRLGQIGNRVHALAGLQVNYLEGVIFNGSHEEALALHVDA